MEGSDDILRKIHHVLSAHYYHEKLSPIFCLDNFYKYILLLWDHIFQTVTINLHYLQENKFGKPDFRWSSLCSFLGPGDIDIVVRKHHCICMECTVQCVGLTNVITVLFSYTEIERRSGWKVICLLCIIMILSLPTVLSCEQNNSPNQCFGEYRY